MPKRKTHEQFSNELHLINPNIELLGTYVTNRTKILCRCKIDGYEWYARPDNLLSGKGCSICANKSYIPKSHKQFIKELNDINPDIEVIGEYINSYTKIKCQCKIDKNIWYSTPNNLLSGHKCPICSNKHRSVLYSKSHEQFVKELIQINPDIEILGEYSGGHNKIQCRCKKDGHMWYAEPHHLLYGQSCPKCKSSKGEQKICSILQQLNITYIEQYRFDDCKYKRTLPFDFYLPEHNMCIEYQGGQHYFAVDYFGGNDWLIEQQKRDSIKRLYCQNNGIDLIEISYLDFDNIEDIIKEKIIKGGETYE